MTRRSSVVKQATRDLMLIPWIDPVIDYMGGGWSVQWLRRGADGRTLLGTLGTWVLAYVILRTGVRVGKPGLMPRAAVCGSCRSLIRGCGRFDPCPLCGHVRAPGGQTAGSESLSVAGMTGVSFSGELTVEDAIQTGGEPRR